MFFVSVFVAYLPTMFNESFQNGRLILMSIDIRIAITVIAICWSTIVAGTATAGAAGCALIQP